MINLDYQSRTPIYVQIVEQIERYVALGILKPKEQIQSIRDLASSIGVNPNTVKKAYEELERRGTIVTVSTKGTFIVDDVGVIIKENIEDKIKTISLLVKELEKFGLGKEEIFKRI